MRMMGLERFIAERSNFGRKVLRERGEALRRFALIRSRLTDRGEVAVTPHDAALLLCACVIERGRLETVSALKAYFNMRRRDIPGQPGDGLRFGEVFAAILSGDVNFDNLIEIRLMRDWAHAQVVGNDFVWHFFPPASAEKGDGIVEWVSIPIGFIKELSEALGVADLQVGNEFRNTQTGQRVDE